MGSNIMGSQRFMANGIRYPSAGNQMSYPCLDLLPPAITSGGLCCKAVVSEPETGTHWGLKFVG